MVDEFYGILNKAMRLEQNSNFIANADEFYKNSITTRNLLRKIYEVNPEASLKEAISVIKNNIMRDARDKIAQLHNVKAYALRRNILNTFIRDEKLFEEIYREIIEEERKSGKKLKAVERVTYTDDTKLDQRQLVIELIIALRDYMKKFSEEDLKWIRSTFKKRDYEKKMKLLSNDTTKSIRGDIEFDADLIYAQTELEQMKICLKDKSQDFDELLKKEYIKSLIIIGEYLDSYGVLETYAQRQNKQNEKMKLETLPQIPENDTFFYLFDEKKLKTLSLTKLSALCAFWSNRFVKVTLDMYKSYIIMYELGLDAKDKIDDDNNFRNISKEKIKALGLKFGFIHQLDLGKVYTFNETETLESGLELYTIEKLSEYGKTISENYKKYFSNIGGLNDTENDMNEDAGLYNALDGMQMALYNHKSNSIYSLIDFLISEKISLNWGVIEEDKVTKYILLGIDIPGLNMPLRLHINREKFFKFICKKQGKSMVRLYDGKDDFVVSNTYLGTSCLIPINDEYGNEIKKIADSTRETDYRSKFINHLAFLADSRRYPKHLQKKKTVIKKGKEKVIYEVIPRYIDLKNGKIYVKNRNDEFVLYSEERQIDKDKEGIKNEYNIRRIR